MPTSCGLCSAEAYCTGLNGPRRATLEVSLVVRLVCIVVTHTSGKTLREELLKGLGAALLAPTQAV